MSAKTQKIALLFGFYIVFHFIAACKLECDCPDIAFPYYDYQKVKISRNDPVNQGKLAIFLQPDSIRFLAQARAPRQFDFISSAYACDCATDGYLGDKFTITAIEVTADKDFNDTLPAGMPLNSIFKLYGFTGGKPLDAGLPAVFGYALAMLDLETSEKPKNLNQTYRFTLKITKSSGETFELQTDDVQF